MIVLLVILLVLVLLINILLWAPLALEIDSKHSVYRLSWWCLFRADVIPVKGDFMIDGQIFFFRKQWSVMELLAKKGDHKGEAKKSLNERKKKKRRIPLSWKMMKALLRSFKVERFDVSLDTGNVIWNAWLFPLAETLHHALRVKHRGLHISFTGDNRIDLKVTNRAGRMAWALYTHK